MVESLRQVANLPDPVGEVIEQPCSQKWFKAAPSACASRCDFDDFRIAAECDFGGVFSRVQIRQRDRTSRWIRIEIHSEVIYEIIRPAVKESWS